MKQNDTDIEPYSFNYTNHDFYLLHLAVPKTAHGSNMYDTYKNVFDQFMNLHVKKQMQTIAIPMLGISINK